jgi:SEC-C motif-containing protein
MESCPCGSGQTYEQCCRPLILHEIQAQSAEALLRSRYTAYVKTQIDYIYDTTHPSRRGDVNRDQIVKWSKKSQWLGLEIISREAGGPEDDSGTIQFTASYRDKEKTIEHKEIAQFKKAEGRWYFFDGKAPRTVQFVRSSPKIGRNVPCPCGSGKKYKKCCG